MLKEVAIKDGINVVNYMSGNHEISLDAETVKKYLVSGNPDNISDQEIVMFLQLCKMQKLNPFLREVYLIKYGTSKATMVTGIETFLKRAAKNPKYRGHEVGITEDGAKAWCKVYVEGYQIPITREVLFIEYVGLKDEYVNNKKTGNKIPNAMWTSKPQTMLKKVAEAQGLRAAFPDDFGGLYSAEEINSLKELPTGEVKQTYSQKDTVPVIDKQLEKDNEIKDCPVNIKNDIWVIFKNSLAYLKLDIDEIRKIVNGYASELFGYEVKDMTKITLAEGTLILDTVKNCPETITAYTDKLMSTKNA